MEGEHAEGILRGSIACVCSQDPRQFTTSIGVRYEDLPKVKAITEDIKAFLDQHPGVDKKLPYGSGLGSLQDWSVQIGLMVSTTCTQLLICCFCTKRSCQEAGCIYRLAAHEGCRRLYLLFD